MQLSSPCNLTVHAGLWLDARLGLEFSFRAFSQHATARQFSLCQVHLCNAAFHTFQSLLSSCVGTGARI